MFFLKLILPHKELIVNSYFLLVNMAHKRIINGQVTNKKQITTFTTLPPVKEASIQNICLITFTFHDKQN